MPLSPLLEPYDTVILDLDGCVWLGDEPTRLAPEAVAALRDAGRHVAFVTNDARHTAEEHVRKLWRLGFKANAREVVTVGGALQFRLAARYPTGAHAVVVGSQVILRHVLDAGLRVAVQPLPSAAGDAPLPPLPVDVVVVAGHDAFDYADLRDAVQAVLRGAALLGAARDATFPMPDGPWPGSGAIIAAVEYATGVTAETVGKPEPALFHTALDRAGGTRALVVGDRPEIDLAGAAAAGMDGALVLTGGASPDADGHTAVAVAADLAELVLAR